MILRVLIFFSCFDTIAVHIRAGHTDRFVMSILPSALLLICERKMRMCQIVYAVILEHKFR